MSGVKKWWEVTVMFMGEFNHTIDPKNRIIVPAKFRESLGDIFVIMIGLDGCLYLTTKEYWDAFAERLASLPFTAESRKLQRHFLRNSQECEPDKQGRILIPQNLKDLAGLEKDVVMVGSGNKIEIWSKERLDKITEDDEAEELTEKMSVEYNLKF